MVVGHIQIDRATEYKLLGEIEASKDEMGKELKSRISNAWKAYWAHKDILTAK